MAPTAALTECFESVGWPERVLPGHRSKASWTFVMALAKASDGNFIVLLKPNRISSHVILPRSSKKAVTPRKYQPDDVKGAIFSTAPDDVHASFSIQFQSDKRHSVRLWMESKQIRIEKFRSRVFPTIGPAPNSIQLPGVSPFRCSVL